MFQYLTYANRSLADLVSTVNVNVKGAKDNNGAPLRLVQIVQQADGQYVAIVEQAIGK